MIKTYINDKLGLQYLYNIVKPPSAIIFIENWSEKIKKAYLEIFGGESNYALTLTLFSIEDYYRSCINFITIKSEVKVYFYLYLYFLLLFNTNNNSPALTTYLKYNRKKRKLIKRYLKRKKKLILKEKLRRKVNINKKKLMLKRKLKKINAKKK